MVRYHIHCSVTKQAYQVIEKKRKSKYFELGRHVSECIILREKDEEPYIEQQAKHHARMLTYWKEQLDLIREKKKEKEAAANAPSHS